MKASRKKGIIWVACLSALTLLLYWWCWPYSSFSKVRGIPTNQWTSDRWLLIRTRSAEDYSILLRLLNDRQFDEYCDGLLGPASDGENPIFGIISAEDGIQVVDSSYWNNSTGPISDCLTQVAGASKKFELGPDHQLLYEHQAVPYAGKSIWNRAVSPDGEYFALLSAQGRAWFFGMPFLGGWRGSGARMHQVFRQRDGKPMGDPVILENADDLVWPCWTPDGRMIIYKDHMFRWIWVIPFNDPAPTRK